MANRPEHWPEALAKVLADAQNKPFVWGQHDCCTLAAACIEAVTGRSVETEVLRFINEAEAVAAMDHLGGMPAYVGVVAERLGFAPVPVLSAMRGDVGLAHEPRSPLRHALVICGGDVWLAPSATGLACVYTELVHSAWRVV